MEQTYWQFLSDTLEATQTIQKARTNIESKISDNDPQAGVRGDMLCSLPERRFLTMRMEVGEAAVPDVSHTRV